MANKAEQFGRFFYKDLNKEQLAKLTFSQLRVYIAICGHVNSNTWQCRVGMRTIAREMGMHIETVSSAVKGLRDMKFIETNDPPRGAGYIYTMLPPQAREGAPHDRELGESVDEEVDGVESNGSGEQVYGPETYTSGSPENKKCADSGGQSVRFFPKSVRSRTVHNRRTKEQKKKGASSPPDPPPPPPPSESEVRQRAVEALQAAGVGMPVRDELASSSAVTPEVVNRLRAEISGDGHGVPGLVVKLRDIVEQSSAQEAETRRLAHRRETREAERADRILSIEDQHAGEAGTHAADVRAWWPDVEPADREALSRWAFEGLQIRLLDCDGSLNPPEIAGSLVLQYLLWKQAMGPLVSAEAEGMASE